MKWSEDTGELSVFATIELLHGNTRDQQGRLLTCEGLTRRIARTEHDNPATILKDKFEGKPLNSPNDIVCKSDGSILFTDPGFGPNLLEGMSKPELPGNVYV